MNLLDQLTRGRALFGVGSGFPGIEPPGMGLTPEHHGSSRAADEALDILPKLWTFRNGDPPYHFETEVYTGDVVRRIVPAPYHKDHPTIITTARREPALIRAARNGWPVFIGTWGDHDFLVDQLRTYRQVLHDSNHPPEVVEECVKWCTYDWLSVVVADSDDEARRRAAAAREDRMEARRIATAKHGRSTEGPSRRGGSSYAGGGDMDYVIAGNPDTVAGEVRKLRDLGVNHILARFMGEWPGATRYISEESMRLFAAEVAPRFTENFPCHSDEPQATRNLGATPV
jgi:alkanesulfonate monooxygenase SsuD/methylene tetrahydromethanopterin reductase-like flavin-dependent oxidoreductase (luciferase family)